MNCKKCGNLMSKEDAFCSECGNKVEKSSTIVIVIVSILGVLIIGILSIIFVPTLLSGKIGNDPKDEPIPYWKKRHKPLKDSDVSEASSALQEFEKKYNTKFNVVGYLYLPTNECSLDSSKCVLESVYAYSDEYPQASFTYCIRESKYGCSISKNDTMYTNAIKNYEYKIKFYDIAEEMGIDTQKVYVHINYVNDQVGGEFMVHNSIDVSTIENWLSKFIEETNSDDYFFLVYTVGKGNNKEYKNYSDGLGPVDESKMKILFGNFKKYQAIKEKYPIQLELKYDSAK